MNNGDFTNELACIPHPNVDGTIFLINFILLFRQRL